MDSGQGMPRLPLSSIDVSQETADWFAVVANLSEQSKRELTRQLVEGHFVRWRRRHVEKVEYFAKRFELTWEKAFRLLADPDRKPPYSAEDLKWARELPDDEIWATKESALASSSPRPETDTYKPETGTSEARDYDHR
jgi:hypothetical protein